MFAIYIVLILLAAVGFYVAAGVRVISNKQIGLIERRWSKAGSVKSGLIALRGEAGFQPEVLRGGWHWFMPYQYRIHQMPLVTIPQGKVGYLFARDGTALAPTQSLASNLTCDNFEDVRAFLTKGGQRGPQRKILREGTYAINLAQFVVITETTLYFLPMNGVEAKLFAEMSRLIGERGGFEPVIIRGAEDMVGVVTIHDGASLGDNEIIAPVLGNDPNHKETYHNNFQDPEKFLAAGGRRGRQLQVLVDGTYYINRLFATVEMIEKTIVEVGYVGVVVSYTGETGADLSGTDYTHGELVKRGQRGVWSEPLLPGKYAFNTFAGKVIMVPTTNFILKWIKSETGSHHFDENLAEVSLITKDAFEPSLPLSVVVHIDYRKAPLVIQRFGDIRRLVEQTLDPMVSAYFKNTAQTRTLIQLLQDRSEIQAVSLKDMQVKFGAYNLDLQEVLIGTPASGRGDQKIETILAQLRARQIAEEQIETYSRQEKAAGQERELRQAEARARQQQSLTESEINIAVQSNQGKAELARAMQQASQVRAMAEADAARVSLMAEAEAGRAARVGIAEAIAIEEQVRAYGGPQFQLTQQVMNRFAQAIQESKVDIVPKIVIGGMGGSQGSGATGAGQGGLPMSGGGGLLESLLAILLSEKVGQTVMKTTPADPQIDAMRKEIRQAIATKPVSRN